MLKKTLVLTALFAAVCSAGWAGGGTITPKLLPDGSGSFGHSTQAWCTEVDIPRRQSVLTNGTFYPNALDLSDITKDIYLLREDGRRVKGAATLTYRCWDELNREIVDETIKVKRQLFDPTFLSDGQSRWGWHWPMPINSLLPPRYCESWVNFQRGLPTATFISRTWLRPSAQ